MSLTIATDCQVPRLGLMLVGWGGNNGSTISAAFEANRNKLEWRTKNGIQKANWFGSITQASTVLLGSDSDGQDVFVPMNRLVPMVNPDDIGKKIQFNLINNDFYAPVNLDQFRDVHIFHFVLSYKIITLISFSHNK